MEDTLRSVTPAVQARVLRKRQQKPEDGSTHRSCRIMEAALGVSKSTMQRIWVPTGLKPYRLYGQEHPDFEAKAADIIELEPPQHAAVFCVDEKTAAQAC